MSEQNNKETFKTLMKTGESYQGSVIKEKLNEEVETWGDKLFDDIKKFADEVNGRVENSFPISDNVYYFMKYNKKLRRYYVKRDLEKSPKMTKNTTDKNSKDN